MPLQQIKFFILFQSDISMIRLKNINKLLVTQMAEQKMLQVLQKGLFSIEAVSSEIDKKILSLAYSPGVGSVCLEIKDNINLLDEYTFRARAVAIISDGSLLSSSGKQFMPVMDWFVFQIKHFSGLDAFPFVVNKQTNLAQLLNDLSTTYGTLLYLDDKKIEDIPKNILFVEHQQIVKIAKTTFTDAYHTSNAISYFINKRIKMNPSFQQYRTAAFSPYSRKEFLRHPFVIQSDNLKENSIAFHKHYQGKILIQNKYNFEEIAQLFTEENLRKIIKIDNVPSKSRKLSIIVSDGTAILGFGDIGPSAGLPVMQGKSLLFKLLGDVEVVPLCIYPKKTTQQEVVSISNIIQHFLAVNLEDIKAPQCFDIENGLKKRKLLPIFHDDQHGTAIVVLAGLINSLKVAGKTIQQSKIVLNGAGAAGITIAKLLLFYGAKDIIVCDTKGIIYKGRQVGMNEAKVSISQVTNLTCVKGQLEDAIDKADIFIGVSSQGALKGEWIKKMNGKPIIFALANPAPQILPDLAKKNGAFIYGSGRSDFQNQINNSLVFPGIFRSIKEHHLKEITMQMKMKAAIAISKSLDRQPTADYIIPSTLSKEISIIISKTIGEIKNDV